MSLDLTNLVTTIKHTANLKEAISKLNVDMALDEIRLQNNSVNVRTRTRMMREYGMKEDRLNQLSNEYFTLLAKLTAASKRLEKELELLKSAHTRASLNRQDTSKILADYTAIHEVYVAVNRVLQK